MLCTQNVVIITTIYQSYITGLGYIATTLNLRERKKTKCICTMAFEMCMHMSTLTQQPHIIFLKITYIHTHKIIYVVVM